MRREVVARGRVLPAIAQIAGHQVGPLSCREPAGRELRSSTRPCWLLPVTLGVTLNRWFDVKTLTSLGHLDAETTWKGHVEGPWDCIKRRTYMAAAPTLSHVRTCPMLRFVSIIIWLLLCGLHFKCACYLAIGNQNCHSSGVTEILGIRKPPSLWLTHHSSLSKTTMSAI